MKSPGFWHRAKRQRFPCSFVAPIGFLNVGVSGHLSFPLIINTRSTYLFSSSYTTEHTCTDDSGGQSEGQMRRLAPGEAWCTLGHTAHLRRQSANCSYTWSPVTFKNNKKRKCSDITEDSRDVSLSVCPCSNLVYLETVIIGFSVCFRSYFRAVRVSKERCW